MRRRCRADVITKKIEKIPFINEWLSDKYGYNTQGNFKGSICVNRFFRWIYRNAIRKAEAEFDEWTEKMRLNN